LGADDSETKHTSHGERQDGNSRRKPALSTLPLLGKNQSWGKGKGASSLANAAILSRGEVSRLGVDRVWCESIGKGWGTQWNCT